MCRSGKLESAVTLSLAFGSCLAPRNTLSRISSATITAVETWPIAKLTAVTATSIMFIGSRSCCSATAHADGGFSAVIRFGPSLARRAAASAAVRPGVASDPSSATTSDASRAYAGDVSLSAAVSVVP
jgi:hypothetical protein